MGSHPLTSMARRSLLSLLGVLILSLALAAGAQAANWTADDLDDTPSGDCDPEPNASDCTLREAVNGAADGDVITAVAGTHELVDDDIAIADDVTINGTGAGSAIVDANGDDRAFTIEPGTVATLTAMTIENGFDGTGGAILNGGTLTLDGVEILNSVALGDGGAIASDLGEFLRAGPVPLGTGLSTTLTVRNSTLGGADMEADGNRAGSDGSGDGGAIYANDTALTIENSVLENNETRDGQGGGLGLDDDTVANVSDSRFLGNFATEDGGGIEVDDGSSLSLVRSLVSGNVANFGDDGNGGGGIENEDESTTNIVDSSITGNTVVFSGPGGGIENNNEGTTMTITRSTIAGNGFEVVVESRALLGAGATGEGGGLANMDGAEVSITNSTVSGNEASDAAGLLNDLGFQQETPASIMRLVHVTIADNEMGDGNNGAGITNLGAPPKSKGILDGDLTLKSVLLTNNTRPGGNPSNCDGEGAFVSQGTNLEDADTCDFGSTPGDGDLINMNPVIGPLADNGGETQTHALLEGSPAIHAASNDGCPADDQRGVPRPQGPACDIGAYEVTVESPAPAAGAAPGPAATRAARPTVRVAGVRTRCVRTSFKASFRIAVASGVRLTSARLTVDGRRVRSTTRRRFSVRVNVRRLRAGRHRLRLVATDSAGNRTVVNRRFTVCARPAQRAAPRFTG
jgi:hypothetical protein